MLARVVWQVRIHAGVFNRPRAFALFSMLDENARYLARRGLPPDKTDIVGRDGVVYRVGWGYGLQFHPLANAGALNRYVTLGRNAQALDLASSLAARLVRRGTGAVLEYYFPFGGGSPPWSSGMAQAVAAQAIARTGSTLHAPRLLRVARRVYASIPGRLIRPVSAGPWIRLYSFNDLFVLNAQLQATLSLMDYGQIINHKEAIALGRRMERASRRLLHLFDTGYWTNYTPTNEADLNYHLYHVRLARTLTRRTERPFWADTRDRFKRYTKEPPVFRTARPGPKVYPWPADGFRDIARIRWWVSKISSVKIRVGGTVRSLGLMRKGWYSTYWSPGRRKPRVFRPLVSAVDLAGNRGASRLAPIEVAVDREPPRVSPRVRRRTLSWRAVDGGTPWLRMTVVFQGAGVTRRQSLGRQPLSGSAKLALPRGVWVVTLLVRDSSGNLTKVDVGHVALPPPR